MFGCQVVFKSVPVPSKGTCFHAYGSVLPTGMLTLDARHGRLERLTLDFRAPRSIFDAGTLRSSQLSSQHGRLKRYLDADTRHRSTVDVGSLNALCSKLDIRKLKRSTSALGARHSTLDALRCDAMRLDYNTTIIKEFNAKSTPVDTRLLTLDARRPILPTLQFCELVTTHLSGSHRRPLARCKACRHPSTHGPSVGKFTLCPSYLELLDTSLAVSSCSLVASLCLCTLYIKPAIDRGTAVSPHHATNTCALCSCNPSRSIAAQPCVYLHARPLFD